MIAPTSRQNPSCHAGRGEGRGGGPEMPKQEKWERRLNFPRCVFPHIPLYCKLSTEQISPVLLQRRHLSRWGGSTASLAARHRGRPPPPPEHASQRRTQKEKVASAPHRPG